MVNNPEKWLERVSILEKNDRVTIHYEVLLRMPFNKQLEILHKFNKKNLNVGIALNPETAMPDSNLLLMNIEHVLIMSVKPGFSGQVFIESTKEKIKKIIKNKTEKGYLYRIAIDGGITKELYDELKQYPVDDFVLGAALFSDKKNPKKELEKFL